LADDVRGAMFNDHPPPMLPQGGSKLIRSGCGEAEQIKSDDEPVFPRILIV